MKAANGDIIGSGKVKERAVTYTRDAFDIGTITIGSGKARRIIHVMNEHMAVDDGAGNRIRYTLDNAGNRTAEQIKDPSGVLQRSISRSFDALNRLQQVSGAVQ